MPNHVHLIMVLSDRDSLSRAVGEAHRCFRAGINARLRVTGHLFQSSQVGKERVANQEIVQPIRVPLCSASVLREALQAVGDGARWASRG